MKIIYTYTDEAPALATHSFLPIIEAFAGAAGVDVELRDISLAARILAQFPDELTDEQRVPDALAELGELVKTPDANIIKLPNISASTPQLKAAIKELQDDGYAIPDYPDDPQSDEEKNAREAYDRAKGSAVNPVLREGNSDRRAPASVKEYVRNHPHSMGDWSKDSKTHVATMGDGDFRSTEQSLTLDADDELRIEHVAEDGTVTVLKEVARRRGRDLRRRGDAPARARRLPGGADRRRQGAGRPLLAAPEGDDDEGLRPDHLRPRRAGVLRRRVRGARRRARQPEQRPRQHPERARGPAGGRARADRGRDQGRPTSRARTSRWSTPTAGSPTCTSPAT